MGDLQGEFPTAPDKDEELPLEELGVALGSGHSGNLGKYYTGLVSRAIVGTMVALIFKYKISSLQDMGSESPARRHHTTHCYRHGARRAPWF